MTKDQKIIRANAGLLELARQLGNVSQACKVMGYSRDSFYRLKEVRHNHPIRAPYEWLIGKQKRDAVEGQSHMGS